VLAEPMPLLKPRTATLLSGGDAVFPNAAVSIAQRQSLKALGTVSPHGGRVSNRVSAECRCQKPMPRTIPGLLGRIKVTVGATTVGRPSSAHFPEGLGRRNWETTAPPENDLDGLRLRPTLGCWCARRGLPPYIQVPGPQFRSYEKSGFPGHRSAFSFQPRPSGPPIGAPARRISLKGSGAENGRATPLREKASAAYDAAGKLDRQRARRGLPGKAFFAAPSLAGGLPDEESHARHVPVRHF
jgi:hypothetical protein